MLPIIGILFIYTEEKSNYVLSTKSSNYIDRFYYKSWFNTFENAHEWFYVTRGSVPENTDVITCMYDMNLGWGNVSDGIFVVNINMNKFERLIFDDDSYQYEKVYLVNRDGAVIYSNDRQALDGEAGFDKNLKTTLSEINGNDIYNMRTKTKMYTGVTLDNEVKMVMETDLKYYSVDTSYERSMFIIAMLLSVLLTLFFLFIYL